MIGDKHTTLIRVKGEGKFTVDGINMYLLWFDKKTLLPLKASSYNTEGKLIEEVLMDDIEIDIEFTEDFFNL
jgi:negative regulator of sigma E activity